MVGACSPGRFCGEFKASIHCRNALCSGHCCREGLPITGMEQEIMEAVLSHDVVVLCGETGCGKTTQASGGCLWGMAGHALMWQLRMRGAPLGALFAAAQPQA